MIQEQDIASVSFHGMTIERGKDRVPVWVYCSLQLKNGDYVRGKRVDASPDAGANELAAYRAACGIPDAAIPEHLCVVTHKIAINFEARITRQEARSSRRPFTKKMADSLRELADRMLAPGPEIKADTPTELQCGATIVIKDEA